MILISTLNSQKCEVNGMSRYMTMSTSARSLPIETLSSLAPMRTRTHSVGTASFPYIYGGFDTFSIVSDGVNERDRGVNQQSRQIRTRST